MCPIMKFIPTLPSSPDPCTPSPQHSPAQHPHSSEPFSPPSLWGRCCLCPFTAPSTPSASGRSLRVFFSGLGQGRRKGLQGWGEGCQILASRGPQNLSPQLLSQIFVELLPCPELSRPGERCPVAFPLRWLRLSGGGGGVSSHPLIQSPPIS